MATATTADGELHVIKIISNGTSLSIKNKPTPLLAPALSESTLSSKSIAEGPEAASAGSALLTPPTSDISNAPPPLPSSQPLAANTSVSEPARVSLPRAAAGKKKDVKEAKESKEEKNPPEKKRKKPKAVPRKEVSTSSGPANEITRAINKKAKKSATLMADRSFSLGTPLGTLGSHEYYVDVTAIRSNAPNIVLKRGLKVKLQNREDLVRIYCAFVSVNGSSAACQCAGGRVYS